MLPGPYPYRYRALANTGSVAQTFSTAVTGSGALAGSGGLTVAVDSCATAWPSGMFSGGNSVVQGT